MPKWAVEKQYYEMPELVGFQTMVILDPNGMSFDAVCVFGPDFQLLFKSSSSYGVFYFRISCNHEIEWKGFL